MEGMILWGWGIQRGNTLRGTYLSIGVFVGRGILPIIMTSSLLAFSDDTCFRFNFLQLFDVNDQNKL